MLLILTLYFCFLFLIFVLFWFVKVPEFNKRKQSKYRVLQLLNSYFLVFFFFFIFLGVPCLVLSFGKIFFLNFFIWTCGFYQNRFSSLTKNVNQNISVPIFRYWIVEQLGGLNDWPIKISSTYGSGSRTHIKFSIHYIDKPYHCSINQQQAIDDQHLIVASSAYIDPD